MRILGNAVELDALGGRDTYYLPKAYVIAHDEKNEFFPSCSIFLVRVISDQYAQSVASSGISLPLRSLTYFSGNNKPHPGFLEIPKGPWRRVARIEEIRYDRPDQGGKYHPFELPYENPVTLYRCERPLAWKLALPDGCTVNDRGFVWP